ncbi:MAG TPA: anthranilate phosphoribosyltransferase [Candidatus Tyrphobacter sp.]
MERITSGGHLSEAEAADLVGAMVDGEITPKAVAKVLTALAARGEHRDEVAGAVRAMRARCIRLEHDLSLLVDVVGTGGDGSGTINISTMAALVTAAAGVPVAKHGNRAASSACGSADVLEAAGLPLDTEPETCVRMLRETRFAFLFAPNYHPAMRIVAPVRRELGIRTIFNLLGPLTNPANPSHQVVGVAAPETMEMIASVLEGRGTRGVVVHGSGGMDEVAGDGPTMLLEFGDGMRRREIDPQAFGVRAPLAALAGGSLAACRDAFFAILGGERSPRADVVALNAAVAIASVGAQPSLAAAFEYARDLIAAGEPLRTFERARAIARG